MKKSLNAGSLLRSIALGLAFTFFASGAKAVTTDYFDVNGPTAGSGVTANGSYSWESTNWTTSSAGTATGVNFTEGAVVKFSAGTDAVLDNFTLTANSPHTFAGMFTLTNGGGTITINGTGILTLAASLQGMNVADANQALLINSVIAGTSGIETEGLGSVDLYGVNTYSGGTEFGTSAGCNFNNNSSFGTGPLSMLSGHAQIVLADLTATSPITITNSFTTIAGQIIFVGVAAAPVTFSGPWTNGGAMTMTMNTAATKMILGGPIRGAFATLKTGPGNLEITGTNANNVAMTVTNGTLEIGAGGIYAGQITVNSAGVLQIDNGATYTNASPLIITNSAALTLNVNTNLGTNVSLSLSSGLAAGAVNLAFSGSDTIYALYIDGVPQASGTWGSPTSGAANTSSLFTGSGLINIPGTPIILQSPHSVAAFVGGSATFTVTAGGATPLSYQWETNNVPLTGQTSSSITLSPLTTNNAGSYSVLVTNIDGMTNSASATLTVLTTNLYTQTIIGDGPTAYWRLDETSGTTMYDATGNGNNGTYVNVTLNQTGFSQTDTDPSIGLPTSSASRGYAVLNAVNPAFSFTGLGQRFSLEAWVYFTNTPSGVERIFSAFDNNTTNYGWAFGVNGNNDLRFTTSVIQDADAPLTNNLIPGVWYYVVMTDDTSYYNFYLNGNFITNIPIAGTGHPVDVPVQLGANPSVYPTTEQVNGRLDEMAIYANTTLSITQITNHYYSRYGALAAPVNNTAPTAAPATNYVSLSTTLFANAAGQDLSYQWYKSPSTMLGGQTGASLTISPLALTDAGSYYVQASNPISTSNSPSTAITVLPIPTNATDLNLTNGLVLHLPFDGDYNDISGRTNNGTNVGSTTFTTPGVVGRSALSYSSAVGGPYNYVTLGVRPDLQFSSNVNFSVSYWVLQPSGSAFTNLPFFSDEVGSTGGTNGFTFAPYANTGGGGWSWTVGTVSSPNAATHFNDTGLINDGNWHNLVHVADRSANLTTYLDGVQVDSQSIVILGNINTASPATIGQDPTGTYNVAASACIDDIGVWTNKLTQLQVSGIYLGGSTNGVSFAAAASVPVTLTITNVAGNYEVLWNGSGTLQATTNILSPYTNVVGASSPYTIPTPLNVQTFYRVSN